MLISSATPLDQLNALAPGGSHDVAFRQSLFAGYIQDDWRARPNVTVNIGLRYEMTTRPTDANTVPGYTVNGYTVNAAGFQEITTLANCTPGTTACGPVGLSSPITSNPTTKNFEPRIGLEWDPFHDGKTAVRAGLGLFDVLPLAYEFGLNTAATAPFQIIGADKAALLGTGTPDPNVNFNEQSIRNRFIDTNPKRALVMNWNFNIERQFAGNWTAIVGYVGSRSVHLSAAADDINLVQPTLCLGVGLVFPCDPTVSRVEHMREQSNWHRIDSNWGGGAGIRPVLFDSSASYEAFQTQLKKSLSQGLQGQLSYTFGKCRDLSSAPVTGDTFENSIAVPLLLIKSARVGGMRLRHSACVLGNVHVAGPVGQRGFGHAVNADRRMGTWDDYQRHQWRAFHRYRRRWQRSPWDRFQRRLFHGFRQPPSRLQPDSRLRSELHQYKLLHAPNGAGFACRWPPPPIPMAARPIPLPQPLSSLRRATAAQRHAVLLERARATRAATSFMALPSPWWISQSSRTRAYRESRRPSTSSSAPSSLTSLITQTSCRRGS